MHVLPCHLFVVIRNGGDNKKFCLVRKVLSSQHRKQKKDHDKFETTTRCFRKSESMMPEGSTESEISPYIFVNDFALWQLLFV